MSSSSGSLQFFLSAHGNAVLSKMKVLRDEHLFCDVSLLLRGPQGSSVPPVHFNAHRVVLAASSDFLRDQFLLHEGHAELSVAVGVDVNVIQMLLLSCYTGFLEVPLGELVSYLTAASVLQINQIVTKCARAISRYLGPSLALLKLERRSDEKEIQQLDHSWPEPSIDTQEEKDAAQPSACIQEGGAVLIRSKLMVGQENNSDCQTLKEVSGDRKVMRVALSEETACCLNTLESEEGGGIPSSHSNNTVFHVTAGTLKCKLHSPANSQKSTPSSIGTTFAYNVKSAPQKQQEPESEVGNPSTPGTQLPRAEKMSSVLSLSEHSSKSPELSSVFVQRPYLCRRCDKVFQHFGSYVGHLKEHRQVFCLVCGKEFSKRSHLTRHLSVHTVAKPFRCPLCHKTFVQRATLQDHIGLHTGK